MISIHVSNLGLNKLNRRKKEEIRKVKRRIGVENKEKETLGEDYMKQLCILAKKVAGN